jgi:hypothetical protein
MADDAPQAARKRYEWNEAAIADLKMAVDTCGGFAGAAEWFRENRPGTEHFNGSQIAYAVRRHYPEFESAPLFRWTPDNIAHMKRLRAKGRTPLQATNWFRKNIPLAADLDERSVKSAWRRWPAWQRGVKRDLPNGYTEKMVAAVKADYFAGLTYAEIAARHDGKWGGKTVTPGMIGHLQQFYDWKRTTGKSNGATGAWAYQRMTGGLTPVEIVYEPQVTGGVGILDLNDGQCRTVLGYAGKDARYCGGPCDERPLWARRVSPYRFESFCQACRSLQGMPAKRPMSAAPKLSEATLARLQGLSPRKAA